MAILELFLQDPRVDTLPPDLVVHACHNSESAELLRRLLRDPRCDPTAQNNAPLRHVCENWNFKAIEILLQDT